MQIGLHWRGRRVFWGKASVLVIKGPSLKLLVCLSARCLVCLGPSLPYKLDAQLMMGESLVTGLSFDASFSEQASTFNLFLGHNGLLIFWSPFRLLQSRCLASGSVNFVHWVLEKSFHDCIRTDCTLKHLMAKVHV